MKQDADQVIQNNDTGVAHLSIDDEQRERLLASLERYAVRVARQQTKQIDVIFTPFAETNDGLITTREEVMSVMWTSYLGELAAHLTTLLGEIATTRVLQRVLQARTGEERREH